MALLRIGSLMKLISPSVLTGFVTGSGVYIFLTQSKYIWGFKVRMDGSGGGLGLTLTGAMLLNKGLKGRC